MGHDYLLQFFAYEHLPPHLQDVSAPFCELARTIVEGRGTADDEHMDTAPLPDNPERTMALRKLLEAKDCAVRALLFK